VMNQARAEGWAEPDQMPDWTRRIRVYGDMRLRYESDLFDKTNNNQFINFPAINQGSAFDINGFSDGLAAGPPFYNTTEDRNRARLRARIGFDSEIADWLSANLRVSTGNQDPVSTNQTLGSSGEFTKYQIYLDRAYVTANVTSDLNLLAGRMLNPFFTTDMIYNIDLGFDGVAAMYTHNFSPDWAIIGAGGVFPVFNSAFNFSTDSDNKTASANAYLYGAQGGVQWKPTTNYVAKLETGIFDFDGVHGSVSQPCFIQPGSTYYCNTDDTAAPFGQGGNTYYAIRTIVPVTGSSSLPPNPQYFGLASRFNVFEVHPRLDILTYDPVDISLEGEFIKNLAFDRTEIVNEGPSTISGQGPIGPQNNQSCGDYNTKTKECTLENFVGGDTGYMMKVTVGNLKIVKAWDWNASLAYKYLESDATLDALNDSDFHLGGTNAKGFFLGGGLGIATNTWLGLRLNSASAVSGPRYNVDVVQLDLNTAF